MREESSPATEANDSFDSVAEALQELRARAGHVSYAQIVSRIFDARLRRGLAARPPGRSTVYDAFKFGRQRVDVGLVLEIAEALGADAGARRDLEDLCISARVGVERMTPHRTEKAPAPEPPPALLTGLTRRRWALCIGIALAAICLNTVGHGVVAWLGLPLYFDMLGTCVAAIALGPWWGAGVGLTTNLLGASINSTAAIPFAAVNVVGALVWGYGIRMFGMGRTLPRFFSLNIIVALTCTLTAVPILVLFFNGAVGHSSESLTGAFSHLGETLVLAVFSSNLVSSVADKLIAGFVALVILGLLSRWMPAPAGALWASTHSFDDQRLSPSDR
jgi:energy-coupling factor transport system substrate-specific component